MKKEVIIKHIIANALILAIIYLFYIIDVRICLIYNIFKIPCPGCGLTRAIIYALHGDIKMSLKYNFLAIPLVVSYIIYIIWSLIDVIKEKDTLKKFTVKHQKIIITISIILFFIIFLVNMNNPLLK